MKTENPSLASRLSGLQGLAFSAPGISIAWLIPPVYAILGDFYLRHTAATAAGVGTAMILSKVIDAITDPPVGYLSDHTRSPIGARKPWLIAGGFVSMIAIYLLFMPPSGAGDLYFTFSIVIYYLAITLLMIPYRTWLGELVPDYSERARLWSWFTIALLAGGVLFMFLPIILSLPDIGVLKTAEFDHESMALLGWVGIILMPILLACAIFVVPSGHRNVGTPPRVLQFLSMLRDCPPFQSFMLGYSGAALGFGIMYSVIVVALSSYFKIAGQIALFLLVMTVVQVLAIPACASLARRFSKHAIWGWAWAGHALIAPAILLISPGSENAFVYLLIFGGLTSILQAPHMLFPVAVMNDIVDYDTLKTGSSRSGNFMSVYTFINKMLQALGFGIGYYIIALFGYDPKAEEHTFFQVSGLMLAVVFVPSLCFGFSAFFLLRFPIDRSRHATIRRALSRRERRHAARV